MRGALLSVRRAFGQASVNPSLVELAYEALGKGIGCDHRMILVDNADDRSVRDGLTVIAPSALGIEDPDFTLQDINGALWGDRYVAATMYEFYYYLARIWNPGALASNSTLVAHGTHVLPRFNFGKYHIFVVSKMNTQDNRTWQEVMCEENRFCQTDRFLAVKRRRR